MPSFLLSFFVKYGALLFRLSLIAGLAWFAINYVEDRGRDKVIIETIETETIIRERTIDAIRNSPRTVDDALDRLRQRQRGN